MNLNLKLLKLLPSLFNALDRLIENHGVYLYLVFVWLALAIIGWILGGGLRKRMKGNSATVVPGIIFTTHPPPQSPETIIAIGVDQTWDDDDGMED